MRPTTVVLSLLAVVASGCLSFDEQSGIEGTAFIGTCPLDGNDTDCADEPYEASLHVLTNETRELVVEFASDADGTFRVEVEPGQYVIRSAGFERVHCEAGPITVRSGDFAQARVQCNNTMR